jgi:hypothetical protein
MNPLSHNPGRFAGLLYVLTSIVGFFAMGYVPGKLIVEGNAAATAGNIASSEMLFRLGIAGALIGQAGFIFVALALYGISYSIAELPRQPECTIMTEGRKPRDVRARSVHRLPERE